jgi:hypothetical protein
MAARVNPTLGPHQSKASESPEHVSIYFNIETYVDLGIPHLKKPPVGTMNSVSQPHIKNMKTTLLFDNRTWQWRKKLGMAKTFSNGSALWIFRCHFCLPEGNVRVYIVPIHVKFAQKISKIGELVPKLSHDVHPQWL